MKDRELPLAYARAVYDLALLAWIRDLGALRDSLRLDRSVRQALEDASVPFETRKTMVDRLAPAGVSRELRSFIYSVVGEGRLGLLDDILVELRRMAEYGPDVVVAEVTTAAPLSDEESRTLEERLVARYGSGIDITWHVDPAILGGVVVRVGDEVIDDSVTTRLEALRSTLKGRS